MNNENVSFYQDFFLTQRTIESAFQSNPSSFKLWVLLSIIKLIKGETGNSRFRLPYALKKLIGFLASQSPAFCSTMSNFALDVILKKFEGLRDVLLLNYLLTLTSAKNIFIETSLA